ncbi:MAG TPA: TIGR03118 family protein [Candidatus Limnocylindrales bacterium]|nr:TIGR03118 family protein [Candidatus Limnocylindrales bacterium]
MARRALALAASIGLLVAFALPASARDINADNLYSVHNLQSDVPGLAAATDSDLVNGWGIVASPTSPWWVSDEGTEKSTLYNGNTGAKLGLVVSVAGGPTGVVFNGSTDFKVDAGTGLAAARFIFATEGGTIAGWNGVGTTAITAVTTPDAAYLGLAIGSSGGANYLYAANFPAGQIDVFDADFAPADLPGDFTDPGIPDGYAPFNVQNIGGEIYIAYAKQNEEGDEEVAGEGFGYVSAFGTDGSFHGRVASAGELNAPWGLAWAPVDFGKFSGDLLVGNFGDGRIHAFHKSADGWEERGVLKGIDHRPIEIDGLWGIGFGNGATSGPRDTLFFAAGPDDETHGLFGSITKP